VRIAILTTGRFHLCDLARELDSLGHEVGFYSLVPRWRTRRFGLPDRCSRWLLPWVAVPYLAARAARGTALQHTTQDLFHESLSWVASRAISRCDVFIGMSGMSTLAAAALKRRYGARIFIERGSRHILSQREILETIRQPGAPPPVADSYVRRELADYAMADTIVVPSWQALRSFTERGIPEARLFRNPYGVDLCMFPPTPAPRGPPAILNVGVWSLQKGCDVLAEAWRGIPGVRLLHVGPVGDAPLPEDAGFEHRGPVQQDALADYYARGDVFALASRQEGLATVQAQALACGLRLVCTDRTGGEDLRELLVDRSVVSVTPPDDVPAFRQALKEALGLARPIGPREILGEARSRLTWRAYGQRYQQALLERA
jgi:glycosyltransferase involved in cell wall biosynthesis